MRKSISVYKKKVVFLQSILYTYKKSMQYKKIQLAYRLLILLTIALPATSTAQQVVVMPHRGTDSLTIDRQNCYTILDPGGYSNYSNDEDSWLYIHSTSGNFILRVNHQMGINDCDDYLDIYYSGADTNAVSSRY